MNPTVNANFPNLGLFQLQDSWPSTFSSVFRQYTGSLLSNVINITFKKMQYEPCSVFYFQQIYV